MRRIVAAAVTTLAVFVLFGVRLVWVHASDLASPHHMPSQALAAELPGHPLALEAPNTVVAPPYHKPANLPGDWWLRHHPKAQLRGDFNTVECQKCHDVDRYCNRCHGYLGVKSVAPVPRRVAEAPAPGSQAAAR